LLERADLVITSSQALQERLNEVRSDVLLVPNGVDLRHFAISRVEMADALIKIERPIIGFHGAIAEWLDYELLLEVVRQRGKYQFVLVGPISRPKRFEKLQEEPNVHYLGSQPYNEIPQYVAGFDVGILPFIIDTVTYGVGSLQALECLAMGKPVVATPLPELDNWPGVILADKPDAFAEQLDQALESRANVKNDPRIRVFIKESSWSETARPLLEALEGLCRPSES